MNLAEISQWATLLNLLLLPIAVAIIRTREAQAKLVAEITAHVQLDNERFDMTTREIDSVRKSTHSLRELASEHGEEIAVLKSHVGV